MTHFIIGHGGQARVIADILASAGYPSVFVTESELASRYDRAAGDVVLIGIGDNSTRTRIADSLPNMVFGIAIHSSAIIARDAEIAPGAVIMAGAVINTNATIGRHAIINTNASVDHDCWIGDFASIAPGVALGGGAKIGRASAIGIGACVLHGCEVGEHTVVGAGAVVVNSLPSFRVCHGVPAKVIRERQLDEPYL